MKSKPYTKTVLIVESMAYGFISMKNQATASLKGQGHEILFG